MSGVGGMVLKWENRSTWGKKICSSATLSTTNPMVFYSGRAVTLTRLRTGWSGVQIRPEQGIFPLSKASKPGVGSSQRHITWVRGLFVGGRVGGA